MEDAESFPKWLMKETGKGAGWLILIVVLIIIMTLIGKALYGF